ncbi:MAG: hypothetical protein KDK24_16065 [Pseudooceanicola sp.]|nr:hypothetical protein [Pseudooceanicola sp.]
MTTRALWLLALPVAWVALLAGVMRFTDAAPAAIVVLPSQEFLAQLPNHVAVLSRTALTVTLASDAPGLAPLLYRQGAWLVLPSGLAGCSGEGAAG